MQATQDFLQNIVADVVSAEEYPTHSSDMNSLDYSVWDIVLELVYHWQCERMQTYKNWEGIKTKKNKIDDQTKNRCYFAVEEVSSSSHKIVWGPIQQISSWTLVKAADNWLNILRFFAFWHVTLLCLVCSLKWEVSTWISVYISKNVRPLKTHLLWFTSA